MKALIKTLRKQAKKASKNVAGNFDQIELINESINKIFRYREAVRYRTYFCK